MCFFISNNLDLDQNTYYRNVNENKWRKFWMNYKHYFRVYMIELDQSRSRSKGHNAKVDK